MASHYCQICKDLLVDDRGTSRDYKMLPHSDDGKIRLVCKECYKKFYIKCQSCGKLVEKSKAITNYTDQACSTECIVGIHNYTFKPPPKFIGLRGSKDFHIGIELEVCGPGKSQSDLAHIAKSVKNLSGGILYCKSDSSINNGFEIVSHPIATRFILEDRKILGKFRLSSLLSYLRANGLSTDVSCGLHMHVGLDVLSDLKHRYRLCSLFLMNEEDMFQLSGRGDRDKFIRYAGANQHETLKDMAKHGEKSERHSIISLNGKTLELRLFQASIEHQRILDIVTFLKGSIEFTKAFHNSKITTNVDNLLSYLHTNYRLNWKINHG